MKRDPEPTPAPRGGRPGQERLHQRVFGIVLAVALVAVVVVFGLLAARLLWTEQHQASVRITPQVQVMIPDPSYGWRYRAGSYRVELIGDDGEASRSFGMTIGDDGFRVTSSHAQGDADESEVWILGGSFTFGWCVDDAESYPWRLQEAFPELRIRNLGASGWGTANALIELRHADRISARRPRVVVVQFLDSHLERNVGAPSHIAGFGRGMHGSLGEEESEKMMGELRFPRARIDSAGKLAIEMVTLAEGRHGEDPSRETAYQVTRAILAEIAELCRSWNAQPMLFNAQRPVDERVAADAARLGFEVVGVSTSWEAEGLSCAPVDPEHPNARGHELFAKSLTPAIRRALSASSAPPLDPADAKPRRRQRAAQMP